MRRSAAAATTSGILPSRQPRSARTQQRILAAAEALLLEQGLEHTTLEQIAERAHVSIGAFYKRFRGKSSLLPALIERVQAQQLQRVRQFIARPDRADSGLGQRIDTLASMFVEAQLEHQRLFRAWSPTSCRGLVQRRHRRSPCSTCFTAGWPNSRTKSSTRNPNRRWRWVW